MVITGILRSFRLEQIFLVRRFRDRVFKVVLGCFEEVVDFLFGHRLVGEDYPCAGYSFNGAIWSLNDKSFVFGFHGFEGSVQDWCEFMMVVLIVLLFVSKEDVIVLDDGLLLLS